MKKIGLFFMIVMLVSFVSCEKNSDGQSSTQIVYICTGGSATKYHSRKTCKGLGNCKGEISAVSMSTATSQGRTACKICY